MAELPDTDAATGPTAEAMLPPAPAPPAPFAPTIRPDGPRPLHPRQVQVWRAGYGVAALVSVSMLGIVEGVARQVAETDLPWPPGVPLLFLALVCAYLVWRMPQRAYDQWRYELAPETLELRRGVVVESHTAIPYFRVQHIDITRSPLERALGLSQLVVRTAAATTDATIPGVAASEAETLRDVILARTGRDDAV